MPGAKLKFGKRSGYYIRNRKRALRYCRGVYRAFVGLVTREHIDRFGTVGGVM